MGNYHKMLKHYKENGMFSEQKMWDSIECLDEFLEEVEESCPDKFWDFMREQHEVFCGPHFDERFAKWQVERMHHRGPDGKEIKGELCHVSRAEEIHEKHRSKMPSGTTVWDVYVALNATKHDKGELFKRWDAERMEEMVTEDMMVFYFMDDDWESDGKVWDYMEANDGDDE